VVLLNENGQAGAVRLLQQRSGSGARYGDGSQTFWVKGDTATYQRGGSYQCKAIQAP
jgi:membrane-bound inhibitor of C-type lysozyme